MTQTTAKTLLPKNMETFCTRLPAHGRDQQARVELDQIHSRSDFKFVAPAFFTQSVSERGLRRASK